MPTVQMAVPASSSPYMSSATAKRAHIRARFIHNTDSLGSPSTLLQPLSRAHETIPISWWWRITYGAHLVRRVHSLPLCTLSSIFTARVSRVVRTKSCAPPCRRCSALRSCGVWCRLAARLPRRQRTRHGARGRVRAAHVGLLHVALHGLVELWVRPHHQYVPGLDASTRGGEQQSQHAVDSL